MSAKGSKPGKKRAHAGKEDSNRDIRSFFHKPAGGASSCAEPSTSSSAAGTRTPPIKSPVITAPMDQSDPSAARPQARYRLLQRGTVGSNKPVELDFRSQPQLILGRDSAIPNPAKVSLGIPSAEEYFLPISRTQAYLRLSTSGGHLFLKNSSSLNEIKVRRKEDGPLAAPVVLGQEEEVEIKPGDILILDGWTQQEPRAVWELTESRVEAVSPGRENGHPNVKKATESSPCKRQKLANRGQAGVASSLPSPRAEANDVAAPSSRIRGGAIQTPSAVKKTPAGDKRSSAERGGGALGSPGNPLVIDEDERGDKKRMKRDAALIDISSDGDGGSSDVEVVEVRPSPKPATPAARRRTPAKKADDDEVEVVSVPQSGGKVSAKPSTPRGIEEGSDEVEVIPTHRRASSSASRPTPVNLGTTMAAKASDKLQMPAEKEADSGSQSTSHPSAPPTSSMPPPSSEEPGKRVAAPAPSSSSTTAKRRSSKEPVPPPPSPSSLYGPPGILEVNLGDTVCVKARMGPGQNKEGGVATVIGANEDGTYDVKYVVNGGKERRLSVSLLTPISCHVTEEDRQKRRASAKQETEMESPERVVVKQENGEREVKKKRASRARPQEGGKDCANRGAPKRLSRVKMEQQEEEEEEERVTGAGGMAVKREHAEDSKGRASHDHSGDEEDDDDEGGAATKVQQYWCKYCPVKFDLTNDPKGKKLRAMQTHVQKCQRYHNKRMRENRGVAGGQWREEMPSQAAKSLESTLTVPDPTFIVTGIQGWLTGADSRVMPLNLMSAVFKALRTTSCAQRGQCFYRILCLSLQAHPPHLIRNAWSPGDLNAFQALLEAVSVMDGAIDYRTLRSEALALAYLVKMFEVERLSLGEYPSHNELKETILGCLVSQQSKKANGHMMDLKKEIVHGAVRTCVSTIKARMGRGGVGRAEAMVKGDGAPVCSDPMDWFTWSDAPEEMASVVMCRLASLVLEMMLATSMTRTDAVHLIDHYLTQLVKGETRVEEEVRVLFYEGLGGVGRVLNPEYEKDVLGCLFDDIKAFEGEVEG